MEDLLNSGISLPDSSTEGFMKWAKHVNGGEEDNVTPNPPPPLPPTPDPNQRVPTPKPRITGNENYLLQDNYLSEFSTDNEKDLVRSNLGVYSKSETLSADEVTKAIEQVINSYIVNYPTNKKLEEVKSQLLEILNGNEYVKGDGSIPFTKPPKQLLTPTDELELANKKYVDGLMKAHREETDPHNIGYKVRTLTEDCVKRHDVYTRHEVYNKSEINIQLLHYVRQDGTTPFSRPQVGKDPLLPEHLATAGYVQRLLDSHRGEFDPHGFTTILENRLRNFYSKSETYSKQHTYSKAEIDSLLENRTRRIVDQAIRDHILRDGNLRDMRAEILDKLKEYVKTDGSRAFTEPQEGVPATSLNHLATLQQVLEFTNNVETSVSRVEDNLIRFSRWKTSGPVNATVGLVQEGTTLKDNMTLQMVCDAIFYGGRQGIEAPKYIINEYVVQVSIYVRKLELIDNIKLYKDDTLIGTYTKDDIHLTEEINNLGKFMNITINNLSNINKDIHWKAVYTFTDSTTFTSTATSKFIYMSFFGLMPYWWNVQEDVTWDSLSTLITNGYQSQFVLVTGKDAKGIEAQFNYSGSDKKSLILAVPDEYPDLVAMTNKIQKVGPEAFAVWKQPLYPVANAPSVLYKIYVFNQSLVRLQDKIRVYFTRENILDNE